MKVRRDDPCLIFVYIELSKHQHRVLCIEYKKVHGYLRILTVSYERKLFIRLTTACNSWLRENIFGPVVLPSSTSSPYSRLGLLLCSRLTQVSLNGLSTLPMMDTGERWQQQRPRPLYLVICVALPCLGRHTFCKQKQWINGIGR